MGANMARRLKESGFAIGAVHDRDAARAVLLATELGTVAAPTLARVTAHSDLVFTVVSDDAAQMEVFKEQGDSLLIGAAGRTFVN